MTARISTFEANLVLLHDVLERGPLSGRSWVIGGMLLGWAREGRILSHDGADADFGFLRADHPAFLQAAPALVAAGFRRLYRWISAAGEPVEYSFQKDGAKFEFFQHDEVEGMHELRFFARRRRGGHLARFEYVSRVPAQERGPFEFLGRTWQKPLDHARYLEAVYGDWHVPRPGHDYARDDRSVVSVRPWAGTWRWTGQD